MQQRKENTIVVAHHIKYNEQKGVPQKQNLKQNLEGSV